jgi:hypothetical protein
MKLERSQPEDARECVDWLLANQGQNDLSPRTLEGCTFWKIAGILYLPVKPMLLLESLAPNPRITGAKRLLALRRAMDELRKRYPGTELAFLARSDARLAETARSYGFEEAKDYVLFRLLDATAARKRTQSRKASASQKRVQDHSGILRADETAAAGTVPGLPESSRRESSRA